MFLRVLLLCLFLVSCASLVQKAPKYISFKQKNDSLFVVVKNNILGHSFLKITNTKNKQDTLIHFTKPKTKKVLRFHVNEIDSTMLIKEYQYGLYYGNPQLKKYDTLYNYGLPFLKGKRYKVLQGQKGQFSHHGDFSQYAIDFKMNVGQEICAIRDGLVITLKENSNIGGNDQKYTKDGNYLMIAHKDGTYSQYVHLQKNGVLVEKGDSVQKGQVIAYSGNTGFSSEPHLHFAVYKPTKNGFVSIPYTLDSIPTGRYQKGKFAVHN
jgi:murein DD-endopeptidase MepM/ murein hydrolase activator NlpD